MTEKDLLIQNLKRELVALKKEKQETIDFIEKRCVYDEHLQGYCFDLKTGAVRTLMFKLKNKEGNK